MANKIIAVDSGKYATKAAYYDKSGKIRTLKFRTKMDPTSEDMPSDSKSCVVEYKGNKYILGEEAETVDFNRSKARDVHKIATYAAVGQIVKNGDVVNLIIGCPLSIYNNVEDRTEYKEFMFNGGDVKVKINGEDKQFQIENVLVCPEGSGVIYRNPSLYKDSTIGIIDIGGLNTNCCVYKSLTPIKSTSFTTELGANVLKSGLKHRLNGEYKEANIPDYLMDDILVKGFIKSHPEDSKPVIREYVDSHLKKIMQECNKKGWDINNIDILFVGGGSFLFRNNIEKQVMDAGISKEADLDNVIGFLTIGGAKYGI